MAGKQDIKAGSAYVELLLKDSKFVKGLRAASTMLKNFGTGVAGIGAGITAAGAAITAPLAAMVSQFLATGDELDKMRQRTGISVEALSELGHAAGQSGTDLASVEKGVVKMQKTLVDAAEGGKASAESFRDLGLSVSELSAMAPDQQFSTIAERVGSIQDPTERAAAAMKVFGKSGTQLLPMIEDLGALRQEARDLGFVMSGESAASAVKLGDQIANVTKTVKFAGIAVGASLVEPIKQAVAIVQRIATKALMWVKANGELVRTIFKVGIALTVAGAAVTALGLSIAGLGVVLGGLVSGIGAVGTVLGVVRSPIGLITAALVAGAFVWAKYTEAGQNTVAAFMEFLGPLLATFQQTFQGIANAISGGELMLAGQIAVAGLKLALLQGLGAISTALGGAAGDILGSITTKLLSGDFSGAWQDTISALAEQWYAFSEGIVAAFTIAASAVKDVWLKATSAIANAILDIASQEGILGDLANKVLGYDDRKNAAKTKRMQAAARAAGIDTLNQDGGSAQQDAANILGGQAAAFQAKLDALNAGRQKLTNEASRRRRKQVGGGADQASAAADAAQAELDALTAKAKQAAEAAAAEDAAKKNAAIGAAEGGQGIKEGVVGSFSAAALASGAAGGITGRLDKIYEENKKFRILGAQTLQEMRNGGKFA